jgi:prepilin-type N-terminal cleavage/methylation domain-containing protein
MNCYALRRGMSLVELLTVIAIISLLVQLALPAIQSSREAARRTSCKNNLRQVGVAVINHQSALGHLPTGGWGWGWMGDPNGGSGKSQPGSWMYQLLPYMEHLDIHGIGAGTSGAQKVEALTLLASVPCTLLYCPSRRAPTPTPNAGPQVADLGQAEGQFWFNANKAPQLARSDYVANVGDRWVYWQAGPPPEQAKQGQDFLRFIDVSGREDVTIADVTGVVVQRVPFSFRHITAGSSRTFFCGEKHLQFEAYVTGQALNDDQSCWVGDDLDTVGSTQFPPLRDLSVDEDSRERVEGTFGSAHPASLNMLLCDGSVQQISYDVDATVFRRFGNRQDD